jgi:hypothetical protein
MDKLVTSTCRRSFLGVAVKIMELFARACPLHQLGAGELPARKLVSENMWSQSVYYPHGFYWSDTFFCLRSLV